MHSKICFLVGCLEVGYFWSAKEEGGGEEDVVNYKGFLRQGLNKYINKMSGIFLRSVIPPSPNHHSMEDY